MQVILDTNLKLLIYLYIVSRSFTLVALLFWFKRSNKFDENHAIYRHYLLYVNIDNSLVENFRFFFHKLNLEARFYYVPRFCELLMKLGHARAKKNHHQPQQQHRERERTAWDLNSLSCSWRFKMIKWVHAKKGKFHSNAGYISLIS